jgi:hypothetical protein
MVHKFLLSPLDEPRQSRDNWGFGDVGVYNRRVAVIRAVTNYSPRSSGLNA